MSPHSEPRGTAIPRTVWVLGLVSLFMDISSEIVHALLPLFLTVTLGASVALVGLIDGIAEATTAIAKMLSGHVSDRIGRRKPLILAGYGLGALSKPLFAIAASPLLVLGARFADRLGKGLRGAPRDALVADVTPPFLRGRAYGLRQSLDTAGALAGPLIAIGLMALLDDDMRTVFWIAALPGLIAVMLVIFGIEGRRAAGARGQTPAAGRGLAGWRRLGQPFWLLAGIAILFTLARFSEAFLVLKAHAVGLPLALAPLVLVAMNLVYSLGAYPAGALADAKGAHRLLLLGLAVLVAGDLLLALGGGLFWTFAGIALWGAHMALTQGLFAKLVAEAAPQELRGTAFGIFSLVTGAAVLAASAIAGLLWEFGGPRATFLAGGAIAALTMLLVALWRTRALRRPGA